MVKEIKECFCKEIQSSIKKFTYKMFVKIFKIRTKNRVFLSVFL